MIWKFFASFGAILAGMFHRRGKIGEGKPKAGGNPFAISGRASGGREGFIGISAPRCHTQKYKHGRKRA